MNKYEQYQQSIPVMYLEDFAGYWVHLKDIASGKIVLPLQKDDDRTLEEAIEDRAQWANERCYLDGDSYGIIILPGRWDLTAAIKAWNIPPKWSQKHITKHPMWGKFRYE